MLRHALRAAIALSCAYFVGKALPWASHPAWLILSVAVVMRGNLEQTLSRRDARVAGTVLGCLVVLGLSQLGTAWVSAATFIVAVGVAHSFVTTRYLVTATGATVMALCRRTWPAPAAATPCSNAWATRFWARCSPGASVMCCPRGRDAPCPALSPG